MADQKRVKIQLRLSRRMPTRQAVVELFERSEFFGYAPSVGAPSADGLLDCWITVPAGIDDEELRALISHTPLNDGADDLEGEIEDAALEPARGERVNSGTLDALALGKPILG